MAIRLAYLMLCRVLSGLNLLVRSDATKDVDILVLRHEAAVLRQSLHQHRPASTADNRERLLSLTALTVRPRCPNFGLLHRGRPGRTISGSTVKHEDDHKALVLTPRASRATACQRRDDPILLEVLMRHCI